MVLTLPGFGASRRAEGQGGHRGAGAVHHTDRPAGGAHPRQARLAGARRLRLCLMQFTRQHAKAAPSAQSRAGCLRASITARRTPRKCSAAPAGVLHCVCCASITVLAHGAPPSPDTSAASAVSSSCTAGAKRRTCCPLAVCSRFLRSIAKVALSALRECHSTGARTFAARFAQGRWQPASRRAGSVSCRPCARVAAAHSPASCGFPQSCWLAQRRASRSLEAHAGRVSAPLPAAPARPCPRTWLQLDQALVWPLRQRVVARVRVTRLRREAQRVSTPRGAAASRPAQARAHPAIGAAVRVFRPDVLVLLAIRHGGRAQRGRRAPPVTQHRKP
jgi:hypothetical protein